MSRKLAATVMQGLRWLTPPCRHLRNRPAAGFTMSLDVVQLLSDLVRIPSVNPMGRPATGDIYYEHRVTGHLEALFRGLGLPVERHTVAPLRDNIITRL